MARSRRVLAIWVLAFVPVVIIVALLAWGFLALESSGRPDPTESDIDPQSSGDSSAPPAPSPSAAASSPSPVGPPTISIVDVVTQIDCSGDATLFFEWTSTNATTVTFAVAGEARLFELPPSGNSRDDFPYVVQFPCPAAYEEYRFAAYGPAGETAAGLVMIQNAASTE